MSNRLNAEDKQHVGVPFGFDNIDEQRAILRRAEALRAEVVGNMVSTVARVIAKEIGAAFGEFRNSLARARTAQELSSLDDRTLADIGIRRSDIPAFVAGQIDFAREAIANDHGRVHGEGHKAA